MLPPISHIQGKKYCSEAAVWATKKLQKASLVQNSKCQPYWISVDYGEFNPN